MLNILDVKDVEHAEFDKEWLSMGGYDFKILTLIAVLAENKLAFRGKLKDIREYLGLAANSKINNDIKAAIERLEAAQKIITVKQGQTFTLTLDVRAEKDREVIKIRKSWVNVVKAYKGDQKVSWDAVLRIWLWLLDKTEENNEERLTPIKDEEVATALQISKDVVGRAKKVLEEIGAFHIQVRAKRIEITKGKYEFQRLGTEYTPSAFIKED